MKKKIVLAFEGPDMCGKSQIAEELSKQLQVPTFKNTGEWKVGLDSTDYFKNLLIYGGTFLTDFLDQTEASVILDRFYPSEMVYAKHFGRETDLTVLKKIDEKFSNLGGKIVICRRKNYDGIQDDLHSCIDSTTLVKLDSLYEEFAKWTKCDVLTLWVDDENLEREIKEIKEWLNK
jgi:thymidylate kinase